MLEQVRWLLNIEFNEYNTVGIQYYNLLVLVPFTFSAYLIILLQVAYNYNYLQPRNNSSTT